MDIKQYIESGILESYALGVVSDQERREVECLSAIYPELREHLLQLDQTLINITNQTAIQPQPHVKDHLFKELEKEFVRILPGEDTVRKEAEVSAKTSWLWIAASVLLLALSTFLFTKNRQLNQTAQEQNEQNQEQLAQTNEKLNSLEEKANLIAASSTEVISLTTPDDETERHAKVFWSAEQKQFLFTANNLPLPPAEKQYQLWAIVNGEPQDMGVIPLSAEEDVLESISYESVDAFAVTLEPLGGSPQPTLDQMKAIGYTS